MTNFSREVTKDSVFNGLVTVYQYKNGYRFSIDAIILAHFVKEVQSCSYLELGSGSGIISMMLYHLGIDDSNLSAIEIQEDLYNLSKYNFDKNGLQNISLIHDDLNNLKKHFPPASFDVIFSNPPYRKSDAGRINEHSEKAIARHEIKASMLDIFKISNYLLKPGGRLKLIYPFNRLQDLVVASSHHNIGVSKIQFIHPKEDQNAKLFLVEAVKGKKGAPEILHPIIIHNSDQTYSDLVMSYLGGLKQI
ncbi:methyltransferase domain-containing protein [bacterium]|nr:methyltransferase domain-containing protein [bacterium]